MNLDRVIIVATIIMVLVLIFLGCAGWRCVEYTQIQQTWEGSDGINQPAVQIICTKYKWR